MAPSKAKVTPKEPEKFAPLSMSPFKITALPTLKGVLGLSTSEIKDDLKELHPQSDDNDTDSDSSMLSEDILDSVYPVQPRSAPRTAADYQNMKYQDFSNSGNNASVDEALYLISDINKAHKELSDKEKLREELELRCQAMDSHLDMEKDKFYSTKKEHENYLKLVQGLYARMVNLHGNYSRQNGLLQQVHQSLVQQRQVEQLLSAESSKAKALSSASRSARTAGKPVPTASADDRSTPLLKVHLRKSNVHVVLHVGMTIPTPMGDAVISKILPEEQKLVLKLPYGLMYAHLPRAVSWCSATLSGADNSGTLAHPQSIHGIQQRYRDTLQHRLTLPRTEAAAIRSLLVQRRVEEDDTAGTDNDDASADSDVEDSASVTAIVTATETAPQADSTTMDVSEAEPDVVKNTKATSYAEKDHVTVFPMPFNTSSVAPRTTVRKTLESELHDNYPQILLESLPLAFAPPASLPYVVSHLHSDPRTGPTNSASRILDVQYETHALQSLYHTYPSNSTHLAGHTSSGNGEGVSNVTVLADGSVQQGATSSLAWQGDVKHLKASLVALGEQIKGLDNEQQHKISEIERLRHKSSALTSTAASIRLNMFTRRLAHRTTLGNLGIVLPPVVPVISNSSKARSSGQSSRNNNNNHSSNGAGAGQANDALASLLLAAGETRSSRSKRTANGSNRNNGDEDNGRSLTQESFGSIAGGGAVPGGTGMLRFSMLRASTDSPFSTSHSQADEAPHSLEVPVNRRSRNNSGALATIKEDGDAAVAANKRSRPSGRRAGDDILATAGEQDEGAGADNDDNDSVGSKNGAGNGAANVTAAARKKPKRRRY